MRERDFERIYAEHAQSLFGFLVYRTGDRALAEDLLADTFERALRARARFDRRKGREKTWLYAIALNLLRDTARRNAAERRALERSGQISDTPAAELSFEAVDDRDMITRKLNVLSTEEREAIALRYGADLTVREIAKATGERLSTVEGRVYRALRKLRDDLER
jgi:RNA polymerase sigma-70 factor (ECF subfamily)